MAAQGLGESWSQVATAIQEVVFRCLSKTRLRIMLSVALYPQPPASFPL